jgi:divalent metal cation (Fe/Co/Zn/Cd) transporter
MEYLKKMPILLGLTGGMGIGFYFLYHGRSFTQTYQTLGIGVIIFYILGIILRNNYVKIMEAYLNTKKEEEKKEEKEGNKEPTENKEIMDKKDETMDK